MVLSARRVLLIPEPAGRTGHFLSRWEGPQGPPQRLPPKENPKTGIPKGELRTRYLTLFPTTPDGLPLNAGESFQAAGDTELLKLLRR